jgi:hypothetical protein
MRQSPHPPQLKRLTTPSPSPSPTPIAMNYEQSVGNTTPNLGSSFLERLGNQASNAVAPGHRRS